MAKILILLAGVIQIVIGAFIIVLFVLTPGSMGDSWAIPIGDSITVGTFMIPLIVISIGLTLSGILLVIAGIKSDK